jgi:enhancing lycopene biosynthesis protein 2
VNDSSPYDIKAISEGMESIGASAEMHGITGIAIDEKNKIVSAPCYMMEGSALDVHDNIQQAIGQLFKWL